MLVSKCHKKTGIKTKVLNRITEVSCEEWQSVYPNELEGYHFFKSMEESGLDQFKLLYIVAHQGKKLVGAAPCFLLKYPLETSIRGPLKQFLMFFKKFNPDMFSISAIACGSPMDEGNIGIAEDSDRVFKAILKRLEQTAKKKRVSIIAFKDFRNRHAKFLDPLKKEGFVKIDSLPAAEMQLDFPDFESYMKRLSGASRYDLRRKFKKIDGKVKIDLEIVDALDDKPLAEVYELYMAIVNKHDMGFEVLPMAFFRHISENMPGKVKFYLWRMDSKLVAFLMALISKDVFIDYYLGLDYSVAHEYHLYFVKFRDAINWCLKNGIKKYEMGVTGYEPKKRLGFEFVPLYIYAKYRNPIIRPFFNLLCNFLKFENFDPVLKEIRKTDMSKNKKARHVL